MGLPWLVYPKGLVSGPASTPRQTMKLKIFLMMRASKLLSGIVFEILLIAMQ